VSLVRAVLLFICAVLLAGCGSDGTTSTTTEPSETKPIKPTEPVETTRPAKPRKPSTPPRPESGEWEEAALLGKPLALPGAQILYAARRPEANVVSIGLHDGGRIVRTVPSVLTPEDVDAPDGIGLYGGDVLGERGPDDRVAEGTYLLVGSVPGDVEVSVTEPGGSRRPVTGSSTRTLRGFTVFYDTGDWEQTWDQVQLAPLTVTTSDGRSVVVRTRSWTG
jgi:hypothetical protein